MKLLVLGGTAWLGREVVRLALAMGHEVACLARGQSGGWPSDVRVLLADRDAPDAYLEAARSTWDAVIDVARHPVHAQGAVAALKDCVAHWVYVSSLSVYASAESLHGDELAACVEPLQTPHLRAGSDYAAGKRACELAYLEALPSDRCWIVRPGLIGGPGDETDRTGYWPARFARALRDGAEVLVPDAPGCRMQIVDVRDLADWLVRGAAARQSGVHHAVGESMSVEAHLLAAEEVARAHSASSRAPGGDAASDAAALRRVPVPEQWLQEQGVSPWAGPRSLPLWVPGARNAGFGARSDRAALAAGLRRRPLAHTLADTLQWELARLAGERKSGLTPEEESALLAAWRQGAQEPARAKVVL